MTISISNTESLVSNNRTYTTYKLATEKKSCEVMVVTGNDSYVVVMVNNASHRAWKGAGKQFGTIAQAEANYKCPQIKAMIRALTVS
jgi:hypothetical protein